VDSALKTAATVVVTAYNNSSSSKQQQQTTTTTTTTTTTAAAKDNNNNNNNQSAITAHTHLSVGVVEVHGELVRGDALDHGIQQPVGGAHGPGANGVAQGNLIAAHL
jgi:hemoglobin-like flavoprotein